MKATIKSIVEQAKNDGWSKQRGGFAVYRLSNGKIDYFHNGQTPNIAGEPDRQAEFIGRWQWNYTRWSRIQ